MKKKFMIHTFHVLFKVSSILVLLLNENSKQRETDRQKRDSAASCGVAQQYCPATLHSLRVYCHEEYVVARLKMLIIFKIFLILKNFVT